MQKQNLSDKGKTYFHLMQQATKRMQQLLKDLLAFSRINTADRKFENSDLNSIIEEIKGDLKEAIAEINAVMEVQKICAVDINPFNFANSCII